MVNLTPPFLKERSSLNLHIMPFIFDNIVQRTVNSPGTDLDQLIIVNSTVSRPLIHFWPLCNIIVIRILIKIFQTIFHILGRIIFKHRRDILMKMNPVLTVEEEHADTDQIRKIFVKIPAVDPVKLLKIFSSFPDDLLQKMSRFLRSVAVRMDPRLLDVIEVFIYKIFSDLPERRLHRLVILIDCCQFFPTDLCLLKILL